MDKTVKTIIVVYIIALVLGIGAMYCYMQMSDSFIKAQKYDYFHDYLVEIEECSTVPVVVCGYGVEKL
jgi:cell division protein YceG involved in septum cleavage